MGYMREFYATISDVPPGLVGPEVCGSLLTHLLNRKMITAKYLVCHFLSIPAAANFGDDEKRPLALPSKNPAAIGLTKHKCDTVPLLPLVRGGPFFVGTLRPWEEAATCETPQCVR